MRNESTFTIVAVFFLLIVIGGVFLVIGRQLLRLALRLALVMAVVAMLLAGAGIGWWQGWFDTKTKNRTPAATTNRRATPANRPAR